MKLSKTRAKYLFTQLIGYTIPNPDFDDTMNSWYIENGLMKYEIWIDGDNRLVFFYSCLGNCKSQLFNIETLKPIYRDGEF